MKVLGQIRQMCSDIYDITGIKTVFYDGDMGIICSHPSTMGAFCTCVRENPEMTDKCLACDREGFSYCHRTGQLLIYQCHMNLTEVVCPVKDNSVVVGYILFGQLLSPGQKEKVRERVLATEHPKRERLLVLLEKMETTEDTVVHACARLMTMCTGNIPLKDVLCADKAFRPG